MTKVEVKDVTVLVHDETVISRVAL